MVPGGAAGEGDFHGSQRDVSIVMHEEYIFGVDTAVCGCLFDSETRLIHIKKRLREERSGADRPEAKAFFMILHGYSLRFRKKRDEHVSDVVVGLLVFLVRIADTDYKLATHYLDTIY
jgi:hypothetical protein